MLEPIQGQSDTEKQARFADTTFQQWCQVGPDDRALQHAVMVDPLTNLYNRTYLEDYLPREVSRSHRYRHVFCVALLAVDDYERLRRMAGERCSDNIVRHLADLLRRQMRLSDVVVHLGDGRFVVALVECLQPDAERACERLRQKVAATKFASPAGRDLGVTLGIGLAQLYPGVHAAEMMQRAGDALNAAQREGKNRQRVWR